MTANQPLLAVENLTVSFRSGRQELPAVEDVSFTLAAGETLAIVGESGSGKSVTSLAIMRLIPDPPGRIIAAFLLNRSSDLRAALSRAASCSTAGTCLS